jgi:hypothetical protein
MPVIKVPKPEITAEGAEDCAIEEAFGALIAAAQVQGLPVRSPLGLVYLPTEQLTRSFQQACRDILTALKV